MHLRLHSQRFEIWESASGYHRTHVWSAKGRTIPPSILNEFLECERTILQAKVDRIVRENHPEPLPKRNINASVDHLIEEITTMSSRIRWSQVPPDTLARLLVASVRLKVTLDLAGCSLPKRRRHVAKSAPKMAVSAGAISGH